jgi:hypothetical protein
VGFPDRPNAVLICLFSIVYRNIGRTIERDPCSLPAAQKRTVEVKIDDREFESPVIGLFGSIYLEAHVRGTD